MRTSLLALATLITLAAAAPASAGCSRSAEQARKELLSSPTETGPLYRFAASAAKSKAGALGALSLTASDGTGLTLASYESRGVVQGPLAFTEVRLGFDNPESRTLEGTFRITLPQGAAISRFAMRLGDRWQEGEVVEKQAARRAYEDFLHRKQDPALLEQAAGNEFSARVFPIPPKARKELIVSYSQELLPEAPYTVALKGLSKVGKLDAVVTSAGADAPVLDQIHLQDAAPDRDLVVDAARLPQPDGLRAGELVLMRVLPGADAGPDPLRSAVVMIDTSASRALGFESQIDALTRWIAQLEPSTKLLVAAFDQGIDAIYRGPASGFADKGPQALRQRQAFGASDLDAAIRWAASGARDEGIHRIVLVTDGVPTRGPLEPAALRDAAKSTGAMGVVRIDALAVGGIRDDALLRQVVTAGLSRDGVVVDLARGPREAARRLSSGTHSVSVKVEGATWQWPIAIDGAQPGDAALVYAEVPAGTTPRIRLGELTLGQASLLEVDRPLLERAWAQARIAQLAANPGDLTAEQAKQAIVTLSTTHRVLSPHTALLVLETEADYARYAIDRNALADILTIEGTRIVRTKRSDAALTDPEPAAPASSGPSDGVVLRPPPHAPSRDRAEAQEAPMSSGLGLSGIGPGGGGVAPGRGLGDIGTIGRGAGTGTGQGFGSGHGRLGGSHRTQPPQVRVGATHVTGKLPPEVIQRIVRQNFGRFRLCYENGLRTNPNLEGRVAVRFVIGRDGSVSTVANAGSSLPSNAVVQCIVRSFYGLSFPKPEAGIVTVVYPINLSPGPAPSQSRPAPTFNASPSPPPPSATPTWAPDAGQLPSPYEGAMAEVMDALARGDKDAALGRAIEMHNDNPGDVIGLVALGEAMEARGELRSAARSYGSIVDLYSSRADLRRMAGQRLERLNSKWALLLAADSYRIAVQQRPDHPSSHRLLAYALLRAGDPAGAFAAIEAGLKQDYPSGRFAGAKEILGEDMALIGAAWIKVDAPRKADVEARLKAAGVAPQVGASVRFVMMWETDGNDVDFHIFDGKGGHAYYGNRQLESGGRLYADVTTGYGPECFTVPLAPQNRASPYRLQAHYYSRGPMGYGMGKLEIIDHDGQGGLTFEERPFVVMKDRAFVELGAFPAHK